MKQICKHCVKSCKKNYAPDCDEFKSFNYDETKQEIKQLIVSKENPKRLKELENRIININGGTL